MEEKHLYFLFAIALTLVFVLYYFLLLRPPLAHLMKLNSENAVLMKEIKDTQEGFVRTPAYNKEIEDLKQYIDQTNAKLVAREEIPFILERISHLAIDQGVKIDQIVSPKDKEKVVLENPQTKYIEQPIEITARSSYHDFGRFLAEIETGNVFFKIIKFYIKSDPEHKYNIVNLTLSAVIYEPK